jgi:hypothetical protein
MFLVESITLSCANPDRLAEFWPGALGEERVDLPVSTDDEKVALSDDGSDLLFRGPRRGPSEIS